MVSTMNARPVKKEWVGVDVTGFDPYKKALQMRLIDLIWSDPKLKAEILANPKAVFERESGIVFPANTQVQVLEEGTDTFNFVIPMQPPSQETWGRFYEQMSVWWTLTYTWWWWMYRDNDAQSRGFRELLEELLIVQFMQRDDWKQQLFNTPNQTLEEHAKIKLPVGVKVKPIQETENLAVFVLPKNPKLEELPSLDRPEGVGRWWCTAHTLFWWMASLPIKTDMGLASLKKEDQVKAVAH